MLNRTSVPGGSSASMSTCEDFLLLILHSHVISASNAILIHNPTDSVMDLAAAIVSNFVGSSIVETVEQIIWCMNNMVKKYCLFPYFGIVSMMLLEKGLERE